MAARARTVTGLAVGLLAVVTAAVMFELFGTVLFAITVAYVLTPVQRWFLGRGWERRRASIATTLVGVFSVLVVVAPIAIVAFRRRAAVAALVNQIPERFEVTAFGMEAALTTSDVVDVIVEYIPPLVINAAVFLSAMSIKLALFGILVFGLLLGHERARKAILTPIPPVYLPFVEAMEERARETLVALLVLQVGTALGTFLISIPMFWVLGYEYVLVLSAIAGALQFLPIIGPIVLLLGLGTMHVVAGQVVAALLVVGVGGVVIGWLPDMLIRPRLARYTTGMSGSLYFIGFIGGITSLGVIGILAGPLIVALLVEGVDHLAAHMPHTDEEPVTATAE